MKIYSPQTVGVTGMVSRRAFVMKCTIYTTYVLAIRHSHQAITNYREANNRVLFSYTHTCQFTVTIHQYILKSLRQPSWEVLDTSCFASFSLISFLAYFISHLWLFSHPLFNLHVFYSNLIVCELTEVFPLSVVKQNLL